MIREQLGPRAVHARRTARDGALQPPVRGRAVARRHGRHVPLSGHRGRGLRRARGWDCAREPRQPRHPALPGVREPGARRHHRSVVRRLRRGAARRHPGAARTPAAPRCSRRCATPSPRPGPPGSPFDAPWGDVQYVERNGERIPIHGCQGPYVSAEIGCFNLMLTEARDDGTQEPMHASSYVQATTWRKRRPVSRSILTYSQATDPSVAAPRRPDADVLAQALGARSLHGPRDRARSEPARRGPARRGAEGRDFAHLPCGHCVRPRQGVCSRHVGEDQTPFRTRRL